MAPKPPSPEEINETNERFWKARGADFERQLNDPLALSLAMKEIEDEQHEKTIQARRPLEAVLQKALETTKHVVSALKKQAASKPRPDPLTELIEEIVEKDPEISGHRLLWQLKRAAETDDRIDRITDSHICYFRKGKIKEVPITALKDRLTRVRQNIPSR